MILADSFRPPLRVAPGVLDAVHRHARAAAPEECCGALLATPEATIVRAEPTRNEAARPRSRYRIGPEQVRGLEDVATGAGLTVIGFYHSHPHRQAAPSLLDIEAAWPWYVYLIVGADGARAFRLREDRIGFVEVPLRGGGQGRGPDLPDRLRRPG